MIPGSQSLRALSHDRNNVTSRHDEIVSTPLKQLQLADVVLAAGLEGPVRTEQRGRG